MIHSSGLVATKSTLNEGSSSATTEVSGNIPVGWRPKVARIGRQGAPAVVAVTRLRLALAPLVSWHPIDLGIGRDSHDACRRCAEADDASACELQRGCAPQASSTALHPRRIPRRHKADSVDDKMDGIAEAKFKIACFHSMAFNRGSGLLKSAVRWCADRLRLARLRTNCTHWQRGVSAMWLGIADRPSRCLI